MSTEQEVIAQQKSIELPTINGLKPSESMNINVVKILENSDYLYARELCEDNKNWKIEFEGKKAKVWSSQIPDSPLQMFKSTSELKDVTADICYDVLQDSDYRYKWDKYLMTTKRIGYLDLNNDVCYNTVGSIPPFRNRDFVLLRSWQDLGNEKFILAHSVWHDKFPPNKEYIRGIVYLTIHFVRSTEKGCQFTYLTLAINIPKLELSDCVFKDEGELSHDWIDESEIQPSSIDDDEDNEEEDDDEKSNKK